MHPIGKIRIFGLQYVRRMNDFGSYSPKVRGPGPPWFLRLCIIQTLNGTMYNHA